MMRTVFFLGNRALASKDAYNSKLFGMGTPSFASKQSNKVHSTTTAKSLQAKMHSTFDADFSTPKCYIFSLLPHSQARLIPKLILAIGRVKSLATS